MAGPTVLCRTQPPKMEQPKDQPTHADAVLAAAASLSARAPWLPLQAAVTPARAAHWVRTEAAAADPGTKGAEDRKVFAVPNWTNTKTANFRLYM